MNSKIIDCYQKLIINSNTLLKKDSTQKFKIISYKKVLGILKNIDFEIVSGTQLKEIKGIGASSIKKIDEVIKTGTLKILEDIESKDISKNDEAFKLQKITGIGPAKAKKLLSLDITLSKLLDIDFSKLSFQDGETLNNLTHHQILGVKYFKDLEQRIPYKEIADIEKYLKTLLKKYNPLLNLEICGSFRRKSKDSGDIDILLYHDKIVQKEALEKSDLLTNFMKLLIKQKFITDHLTSIDNPTKYMGFCKFKKYNRRIDIRLISKESLASALLYFTGSGEFNKSMRSFALSKQFTINEYGIYKIDKMGKKTFKMIVETEKDIFKILDTPYVEPWNRLPNYKFN